MSSPESLNIITAEHIMKDFSDVDKISSTILNSKTDSLEHCHLTDISCMANSFYLQIQGMDADGIETYLDSQGISVHYSLPEHCPDVDVKGIVVVKDGSHEILLPRDIGESEDRVYHLFLQLGNLFTHEDFFNKDKNTSSVYVDSQFCQEDYESKNEQSGFFALRLRTLSLLDSE